MTTYTESLSDSNILSGTPTVLRQAVGVLGDEVIVGDLLPRAGYIAGAVIVDTFKLFGDDPLLGAIYKITAADTLLLTAAIHRAVQGFLSDTLTVHDVQRATIALTVLSKLLFGDTPQPNAILLEQLADTILASQALQWFYGAFLVDDFRVSQALAPTWQRVAAIADGLQVGDTLTPLLQISMTLADTLDMTDEQALSMIYSASISDGICFRAAYIDPGGGFTTWAINTRTSAITEYQNFAFNSFAQMGNHYLGATSDGLFALDGNLDDTESIIARIQSGSAQFNGSRLAALDAAYLGCRVDETGKTWLLKLHTGQGQTYIYQFQPLNRRTSKVFFGKGLRARYFSWELITAGEDFDLDMIEFVPIGAKRRT